MMPRPIQIIFLLFTCCHGAQPAFVATTPRKGKPTTEPVVNPVAQPTKQLQKSESLALWKLALAGGLPTMVGDVAMHPIDCIKTIQQSDEGMFLSFAESARLLWNELGLAGFYRSVGVYVASDASGGSVKFAV